MLLRRIAGCELIALVVLARIFVLDTYPLEPRIVDWLWWNILLLAPRTFVIGIVAFLVLILTKRIRVSEQGFAFLISLFGWTLTGFAIASVIVIACSLYYQSPQGPFSIIFLNGPLGAGLGELLGLIFWLLNLRKNHRFDAPGSAPGV